MATVDHNRIHEDGTQHLFAGTGEMARRCREFDWGSTPLGPLAKWSRALSTMADAVIASRAPMLLMWGPSLVQLYNDAFRPSLGSAHGPMARHPRAFGMAARDFWTDTWNVVGPQLDGVMTRGESVWFENLHLPIERDGRLDDAWWTYSFSPVHDDTGRIGGVLLVCIETTEAVRVRMALEQERARYFGVLEAMADAHVVLDHEFRVLSANRAMVRNVGIPRDQMIGRTLWELFPGLLGTRSEAVLRRVMTDRVEEHVTERYRDSRLDIIADVDVYPTQEHGAAIFWRDVGERVRVDEARERALAEAQAARAAAESASRAKADFLAVMSHELRTPLNAISGYVELLAHEVHGPITPKQRTALERIQRNQEQLLDLINAVLSFARIDSGAVRYDVDALSIADELAACAAMLRPEARRQGLTFSCIPCSADLRVRADPEKLRQILRNLLGNAMKFTERGGEVRVECVEDDSDVVRVRVRDTGRGIAPERLESVFQPFVQVDSGRTRVHHGVGLGLAISRALARGMGGDVTASSELGKGSIFELTLPRA